MRLSKDTLFRDIPANMDLTTNPYVTKIMGMRGLVHYGEALSGMKGNWREKAFAKPHGTDKKLILEIGCHFGKTLFDMAHTNPEHLFIGCDITFKRVVKAGESLQKASLQNSCSAMFNARYLPELFIEQELDGVLLFFPDPWQKKARQRHNRLLNEDFVSSLAHALKPEGFFWLKTDAHEYFEESVTILEDSPLFIPSPEKVPLARDYESTFSKRFADQGVPTYGRVWRRSICR